MLDASKFVRSKSQETTSTANDHNVEEKFAHYTTSRTLENLPNTDFSLVGPVELITRYRAAPKSGELFKGGFQGMSPASSVCLTSLTPEKHYARYNPKKSTNHDFMVSNYTENEIKEIFFNDEVGLLKGLPGCFPYESLIKLAIQAQERKLPVVSIELYNSIENKINDYIFCIERTIPSLYVMSRFISFNGHYDHDERIHIVSHIIKTIELNNEINNLVLAALKDDDSVETDNKIERLVNNLFKEDIVIKNMDKNTNFLISHKATNGINNGDTLSTKINGLIKGRRNRELVALEITDEEYYEDNDQSMLKKCLRELTRLIPIFKQDIETIKEILKDPNFINSFEEKKYFSKKFPIAFIVQDQGKLEDIGREYRADKLTLGKEIKTIAVPEEHTSEVQAFLQAHQQQDVGICNLNLLKQDLSSYDFNTPSVTTTNDPATAIGQVVSLINPTKN